MSSTSGAGWFTGPLVFGSHHASLATFLGEAVPPEALTVERLSQVVRWLSC